MACTYKRVQAQKKRSKSARSKIRDHSGSFAIALFSLFFVVQAAPSKSTITCRMKASNVLDISDVTERSQDKCAFNGYFLLVLSF